MRNRQLNAGEFAGKSRFAGREPERLETVTAGRPSPIT
jgi:hypothetical protein